MKENQPLLFINSAQTQNKTKNQYVFDSRYDKKDERLFKKEETKQVELPKEVVPELREEEKVQVEEVNSHPEEKREEEKEVISENDERMRKLHNKLDLLNKRARLGRYVYVSVETSQGIFEGYFVNLLEKEIELNVEDKEKYILIEDILDVIIIRV